MDISRLKRKATDHDVPWIAVAFQRNTPQPGRHTGIIYRGTAGVLCLAHMAGHEDFRDQTYDPDSKYYCVVPQLPDPYIGEAFADYCAHAAASIAKQQPPYNLLEADPKLFDKKGNWISRDPDSGFNCSSFVIAVFHSYNIKLVRIETWPIGLEQDIEEQTKLVCALMTSPRPQDRAQAIKISPQIGKFPRIRPEQAAGACLEDNSVRPVDHTICCTDAQLLLQIWDEEHC